MKRTKIVCTIGPASASVTTLVAMMKNGMNVARLNFSHGTHQNHKQLIKMILAAAKKVGEPVALLADIQGPKIRLGVLPDAGVVLKTGSTVEFTTATDDYKDGQLPVTHKLMHKDVKKGDRVMIDDGILEVKVTKVGGRVVTAKVINGGTVTSHKGMNFPDSTLSVSPITEKDRADVEFAVVNKVHWIAMSFVTRPEDVKALRKMVHDQKIIVKIEKHEALDRFDEILAVCDGIMVARGDLGVETPAEDVPVHQKEMIAKCRAAGKPVVVATQMLDSMMRNPRPTRAEVSDVANAVIDHTDAVMLSGESASGKYPVEAVQMMNKICLETESSVFDDIKINSADANLSSNELVSAVLATLARTKKITAAVAESKTESALSLNRFRPEIPIFLACASDHEARQWNLAWGIQPFVVGKKSDPLAALRKMKKVKKGQTVAVILRHGKDPEVEVRKV